jgi:TonB family protein
MIPRILVPMGARLPATDVATTRRRPSTLDERTLVPSSLPIVRLDGKSNIPSNLPLESIATRVVVPRDVNVEAVQRPEESTLPLQPTDMDERITVPQGAVPPEEFSPLPVVSEELIEPDILQTGEVAFLTPSRPSQGSFGDAMTRVVSITFHILLALFLVFEPKIFKPHVRTSEEEEIGRRQITVLLPPGALESLRPSPRTAPVPHESMRVDPDILRRVAPRIEPPAPAPPPEPPKKELPSAPVPKPNAVAPPVQPPQGARGDLPKTPLKLETPDMPVPQTGLVLPKQSSPGDSIRDAARQSGKINSPAPIGGGGPLPGGGRGGGGSGRGTAGGAMQMLTDDEGVDFHDYLQRIYIIVKQNWFSVMPSSVQLGDNGEVSLIFKIYRNGGVTEGDPQLVYGSGKEPLDRAAVSSIRASNPFPPLPTQFKAPYIELRYTYCYNEARCPVGR